MRWTSLLCLAIRNFFRYGCSHVDSRWGHVSLSLVWHSVQLGFWYLRGQKIFYLWLPIYWAYLNFRVWVTCVFVIFSSFQKWLESFWLIWSFDNHLSTYGNFCLADVVTWFTCSFVMNVWRLQMALSCVAVGGAC